MSQKRSQRIDDGIHTRTFTLKSLDGSEVGAAELRAMEDATLLAGNLFSLEIRSIEDWFKPLITKKPVKWPEAGFVARQVFLLLSTIRRDLERSRTSERTVVLAYRLGRDATDAQWRLTLGNLVRAKRKANKDARVAARQPRPKRKSKDSTLANAIDELRKTNPTLTNNALARIVLRQRRVPLDPLAIDRMRKAIRLIQKK